MQAGKHLLPSRPFERVPVTGDPMEASAFAWRHRRWSTSPAVPAVKQAVSLLRTALPIPPSNHRVFLSNSSPTAEFTADFKSAQFLCTSSRRKSLSGAAAISTSHRKIITAAVAANSSGSDPGLHVHPSRHDLPPDRSRPEISLPPLLLALAIPLIAGAIDSLLNSPTSSWYRNLKKPAWIPPGWIFTVVWGALYGAMGFASWLVWTHGGWEKQAYPLMVYSLQLALNLLWVAIFFGGENLGLAMLDMVLLIVAVAACIAAFQPVNLVAADLMKVYLVWVMFAAFLNYTLWVGNDKGKHP